MTDQPQDSSEDSGARRLVITINDAVCRVHPLVGEAVTLGRGNDCDVVLEHSLVSRKHGRIYLQHGRLWIEDLDSAHGTTLNGRRIDRAPFGPGDKAEIGPFRITLVEGQRELASEATQQGAPGARLTAPGPSGQELDILLGLLQSLGSGVSRAQVLDQLLGSLVKAMQAARALLFRWDNRRATARCEMSLYADGADRDAPVSGTLVKKVAREREPYLATDLMQNTDATPSLTRLAAGSVQSVIIAPLKLGRKLVGILYLDSPAARKSFTTGDLDLLARSSAYLAGVLDAMEEREELTNENRRLREAVASDGGDIPLDRLTAAGSPMAGVLEQLKRAAARDVSVLLTGETGTGKEVAARALHRLSSRAGARFIAINCGAIPESLIESELFGYRKGAFSGAQEDRAGLVEMANHGTLFLDEVGELPLSAQVRLLRVLEERSVVRLGSSEPIPVDFRLVAATHRDLKARAAEGLFRQDLYYRLNVFAIALPPLRERRADLPLLVDYLIGSLSAKLGVEVSGAAPDLLPVLTAYDWPGNVRELRNAIERALVVEDAPQLTARGLPVEVKSGGAGPAGVAPGAPVPTPRVKLRASEGGGLRKWNDVVRELERAYLKELMQQVGANVTAMARVSGLARLTLYRKLGQLGLDLPDAPPLDGTGEED